MRIISPQEFESVVATLLTLSGCDVQRETLIGHKKVDVYAEERGISGLRRIAVECKRYASPLTQKQVSGIFANYLPLQQDGHVDDILLVTSCGLAPSAAAFVRSARGMSHLTLAELQSAVIDFSSYLSLLRTDINDDGLADYYVRPQIAEHGDLHKFVQKWLIRSSGPLAILGSYGMGKTSFARYMAAMLAERALRDPIERIPILIRLSDIAAEQSLEGLLARALATGGQARRYSFDAFMELNRRGRFVIFLDGFDEMKHTLTWDQFRYNFRQLNRLSAGPDTRVILLGRPTAFLSEAEHQYTLHGLRRIGKRLVPELGWPDYQEVLLRRFSPADIASFLGRYAHFLAKRSPRRGRAGKIIPGLKELPTKRLSDLASRPVQLKILAEVLPQWHGDINELDTTQLYSTFIDLVIEREQEKLTRRRFSRTERRAFARDLAFWLWTNGRGGSVDAQALPASLFPPPKGDDTEEGVRRDMISACFLEKKGASALYFPHRSFQEFLVAEKISVSLRAPSIDVAKLAVAMTTDVAEFLSHLITGSEIDSLLRHLEHVTTPLKRRFLEVFVQTAGAPHAISEAIKGRTPTRWSILLLALATLSGRMSLAETGVLLQTAMRKNRDTRRAALYVMLRLLKERRAPLAPTPFSLLLEFSDAAFREFASALDRGVPRPAHQIFADGTSADGNLLRLVSWARDDRSKILRLNVGPAFRALTEGLQRGGLIEEWMVSGNTGDNLFIVDKKPGVFVEDDYRAKCNFLALIARRYGRLK